MKSEIIDMKTHLSNILDDIDLIFKDKNVKYNIKDILKIKNIIEELKLTLDDEDEIYSIKLVKVKLVSNMIYDLNYANLFSNITDHISNEFYAFSFLLQEMLKEKGK